MLEFISNFFSLSDDSMYIDLDEVEDKNDFEDDVRIAEISFLD